MGRKQINEKIIRTAVAIYLREWKRKLYDPDYKNMTYSNIRDEVCERWGPECVSIETLKPHFRSLRDQLSALPEAKIYDEKPREDLLLEPFRDTDLPWDAPDSNVLLFALWNAGQTVGVAKWALKLRGFFSDLSKDQKFWRQDQFDALVVVAGYFDERDSLGRIRGNTPHYDDIFPILTKRPWENRLSFRQKNYNKN